jgi:Arc/MetJ-type ribon-helix-helix transcriptional regulator
MPNSKSDDAQIVSVRLPRNLIQRLDRYLDWWNLHRQAKSSRNAAIRQALDSWLDDQEQRAGFLEPQLQRQQFQNAYHSLSKRHEWVAIHHLRQLMPWSRERFDAMVETLRADHQVELERAEPGKMSETAIDACYQVHGQFYHRLRSCLGSTLASLNVQVAAPR